MLQLLGVPIDGPANVFVTTTVLWRIQRYLSQCLRRSIMRSITMWYARQLLRRSYAWERKMAWLIWLICLQKCSLPIGVEHYDVTSCINGSMPWVIDHRVGEVVYPLERTRSVGSNTRSWRMNQRLGLNHSITRAHDLRGPLKYGTETASTVVIDDKAKCI